MVAHTFNPSSREAEAGRSLQELVPGLQSYRETLSQKTKNKNKKQTNKKPKQTKTNKQTNKNQRKDDSELSFPPLASSVLGRCGGATTTSCCGAQNGTQGLLWPRQAFYQQSCIPVWQNPEGKKWICENSYCKHRSPTHRVPQACTQCLLLHLCLSQGLER